MTLASKNYWPIGMTPRSPPKPPPPPWPNIICLRPPPPTPKVIGPRPHLTTGVRTPPLPAHLNDGPTPPLQISGAPVTPPELLSESAWSRCVRNEASSTAAPLPRTQSGECTADRAEVSAATIITRMALPPNAWDSTSLRLAAGPPWCLAAQQQQQQQQQNCFFCY